MIVTTLRVSELTRQTVSIGAQWSELSWFGVTNVWLCHGSKQQSIAKFLLEANSTVDLLTK